MKKNLVLFSLVLSVSAFSDNFVGKSFAADHQKCKKMQAHLADWEAVREDCMLLDQIMESRAKNTPEFEVAPIAEVAPEVIPEVPVAPAAPAADLPKDEI
ncbi:MAG: hypothetical protein WCK49_01140 [Myxococcaceae bacterium]